MRKMEIENAGIMSSASSCCAARVRLYLKISPCFWVNLDGWPLGCLSHFSVNKIVKYAQENCTSTTTQYHTALWACVFCDLWYFAAYLLKMQLIWGVCVMTKMPVVVEKLFYSSWTMKHNLLPEADKTQIPLTCWKALMRHWYVILGVISCWSLKMIRNKLGLLVFFPWAFLMITALTEFSMTDSRTAEYS